MYVDYAVYLYAKQVMQTQANIGSFIHGIKSQILFGKNKVSE